MDGIRPALARLQTPFVSRNIEKRIDPKRHLANAESVIVLGRFYGRKETNVGAPPDGPSRGSVKVSYMAAGPDYHTEIKKLLAKLIEELSSHGSFEYRMFVDSKYLVERELAVRAGLGFYGKNCMVVSPAGGSFFNVGCILTDARIEWPETAPLGDPCGQCDKCVSACPGNAIRGEGYEVDASKCVSYITQKKGLLSEQEIRIKGSWAYGCDVCQLVCPYNGIAEPLHMDAREFIDTAQNSCAGWIGEDTLRRNVGGCA